MSQPEIVDLIESDSENEAQSPVISTPATVSFDTLEKSNPPAITLPPTPSSTIIPGLDTSGGLIQSHHDAPEIIDLVDLTEVPQTKRPDMVPERPLSQPKRPLEDDEHEQPRMSKRRLQSLQIFNNRLDAMVPQDRVVAEDFNRFLMLQLKNANENKKHFQQLFQSDPNGVGANIYRVLLERYLDLHEFISDQLNKLHYEKYAPDTLQQFQTKVEENTKARFGDARALHQRWQTEQSTAQARIRNQQDARRRAYETQSGRSLQSLTPHPSQRGGMYQQNESAGLSGTYSRIIPPPPLESAYRPTPGLFSGGLTYAPDPNDVATSVDLEESVGNMVEMIHKDIVPHEIPSELDVSVLEHQRLGLGWLVRCEQGANHGSILADDMGLGKTVQTIALIYANPPPSTSTSHDALMTLIVCPLSLVSTWRQELESRVHPEHRKRVYVHNNNSNKNTLSSANAIKNAADVVITTYDTLVMEFKAKLENTTKPHPLTKIKWWRIVLDEAHIIKNDKTRTSLAAASLDSVNRLCLSGTPMQNKIEELWSMLRFLRIRPYWDDKGKFMAMVPKIPKANDRGERPKEVTASPRQLQKLQALLTAVLLRRKKDTVINGQPILANLPSKTVRDIEIELEGDEKENYTELEAKTKSSANLMMEGGDYNFSSILTLLLRLRQTCCHRLLAKITTARSSIVAPVPSSAEVGLARSFSDELVEELKNAPSDDRFCTSCNEQLFFTDKVVVIGRCGHVVCVDCSQSLPQYYPNPNDPGGAVCPSCSRSVLGTVYLNVILFAHANPRYTDEEVIENLQSNRRVALREQRLMKQELRLKLDALGREADNKAMWDELQLEDESEVEDTPTESLLVDSKPDEELQSPLLPSNETAPTSDEELFRSNDGSMVSLASFKAKPDDTKREPSYADFKLAKTTEQEEISDEEAELKDGESKEIAVKPEGAASDVESLYKISIDQVAGLFHVPHIFDNGWVPSAKVDGVMEVMRDIWAEAPTDKIIVFSYFTSMLDLMSIPLDAARIEYLTYTGELSSSERSDVLDKFSNSSANVLLISLRAGNVGLTLTAANRVILVEPFWNPYVEEQAKDRVHRIGQTKPVTIYRMLVRSSVEDRIVDLQRKKMELIESALNEKDRESITRLNANQLRYILGIQSAPPL